MSCDESTLDNNELMASASRLDRIAGHLLANVENFAKKYGFQLFRGAPLPVEATTDLAVILQGCVDLVGITGSARAETPNGTSLEPPSQLNQERLEPRN